MRSTFHTFVSARRQSYVAHHPQIDDGVAGHAAREIDVRIDIAQRERARRREDRQPPVEPRIARTSDRSPTARLPVHKDHVIQLVDRLEAEHERRKAVLLQDDRGEERRLEAVRAPVPHDAAKAAKRGSSGRWFGVVGKAIQISLDVERVCVAAR